MMTQIVEEEDGYPTKDSWDCLLGASRSLHEEVHAVLERMREMSKINLVWTELVSEHHFVTASSLFGELGYGWYFKVEDYGDRYSRVELLHRHSLRLSTTC